MSLSQASGAETTLSVIKLCRDIKTAEYGLEDADTAVIHRLAGVLPVSSP
jgi:hypothetical protein